MQAREYAIDVYAIFADPEFSNELIGDGIVTDIHITGIHIEGNLARDVAPLYCQFHYLKARSVNCMLRLHVLCQGSVAWQRPACGITLTLCPFYFLKLELCS